MDLSKATGKIRAIWQRLSDRTYREAYVAGKVANDIAFQVYYLREHRGWTQGELAHRANTQQPQISRIERSVGALNVSTLLKVAAAFNVGLSIRFVPFNRLVAEAAGEELSSKIPDFDDDSPPLPITQEFRMGTSTVAPIQIKIAAPTGNWMFSASVEDDAGAYIAMSQSTPGSGDIYAH